MNATIRAGPRVRCENKTFRDEERIRMANDASARLRTVQGLTDPTGSAAPDEVLVHVRFHPNAEIFSIGEKPDRLSEREWFKYLLDTASPYYQVFAGGRGFFRIPRASFETILEGLPG